MGRLGRADFYAPGEWNVACSMCGRKRKAGYMVRNWQGLWRCPEHNEPRQPQDFARGVKDIMTTPYTQPETDTFVSICTLAGISAIPLYAMPGCSMPGMPLLLGAADTALDDIMNQIDQPTPIGQPGGSIGV